MTNTIIIATALGQGIRFKEDEVRSMGRQAAGVIGIRLKEGEDYVVGMEIVNDGGDILFATENGYGKRVGIQDFRVAHRGGLGVRTIPTDKRNGKVIGLAIVGDDSDILLIDQSGKIIRLPSQEIRTLGRQAKGVRLIRLDADQKLSSAVSFEGEAAADETDAGQSGSSPLQGARRMDGLESDQEYLFSPDVLDNEMLEEGIIEDFDALREPSNDEDAPEMKMDADNDDSFFQF